ncbi:MAG TPA: YsnF/AvaK domain-containing protein [Bryobacteraceae bacterium]|nr:YsnF/AvaK domain-containing protein [Bryobacteraceae bacterium]
MASPTARTVVGVFDDYAAASKAAHELAASGIPADAVHLQSNLATGAAGHGSASGTGHHGGNILEKILGFGRNDEAGHYAEAVRRGKTVMAVTTTDALSSRVAEIMNQNGGSDIDRHVENFRLAGYATYDPNAPAYTHEQAMREREQIASVAPIATAVREEQPSAGAAREGTRTVPQEGVRTIPIVEEELKVGKRTVQRGVRIYTHVVEEPVDQEVQLHEEHTTLERHRVDRPLGAGEEAAFRDQTLEFTETSEEPIVSKSAHVKEEIVIGKEARDRTQKIHDILRHTEVRVEQGGAVDRFRADYDRNFARTGKTFDSYRPAYKYGYEKAREPGYRNRSWSDAESQLEREFSARGDSLKWSEIRDVVHRGWEYGKLEPLR